MTQPHPPYNMAALPASLQPHLVQQALQGWSQDAHCGNNNDVGMPAAPLPKQGCADAACGAGSMAPLSPIDEEHEETMAVDLGSIMMVPALLQRSNSNAAAASSAPATAQCTHSHAPCSAGQATAAQDTAAARPSQQQHARSSGALAQQQWLYALVGSDYLFKPCPNCMHTHSGREVLMTYFDIDAPMSRGYCTYCPERHRRPRLLQIRRSTYHEVIKAGDIGRLTDISGIQHYVINGSKVLFLNPRPQPRPPKGVIAPARCSVDGRQLMDHGSTYCSLRCKLEVEDPCFGEHMGCTAAGAAGAADASGTSRADQAGGHRHVVAAPPRAPVVRVGAKRTAAADVADDAGGDDQDVLRWAARGKRRSSGDGAARRGSEQGHGVEAMLASLRSAASPAASVDSGRSSTCVADCRWQHRRKGEPMRSPLQ